MNRRCFALITSLRRLPFLRCLSLLLALCCFWSFAGASVAIAASPNAAKANAAHKAIFALAVPLISGPHPSFYGLGFDDDHLRQGSERFAANKV